MRLKLPDGNPLDLDAQSTALDAARSIGAGLAKAAIGAKVNGQLVDVNRPLGLVVDEKGVDGSEGGGEGDGPAELVIITAPRTDKHGRSKWPGGEPDPDSLYLLRHSAAHVMAEAILRLHPSAQLAYGPPLDNGFYYDLALDQPISSDEFADIEQEMANIVAEDRPFTRYELEPQAGLAKLDQEQNKYKVDNARRALDAGAESLSWYVTGNSANVGSAEKAEKAEKAENGEQGADAGISTQETGTRDLGHGTLDFGRKFATPPSIENFEDLCMGPHVPSTGRIGAFKVMSTASSHWHGDVNSDRFQRIYGTAFFQQADLDEHLEMLEQAKQRDHRVLGQRLGLFALDEKVGPGLVLWKPKGAVVRDELQKFIGEHLKRQGYDQVFTPHIGRLELYKTSGHYPYYQDSQFPPLVSRDQVQQMADEHASCGELVNRMDHGEIDGFLLKPMNCPHHIRIYSSEKRSYRDLPIRMAEFGTVYRWEQSGELAGMTRVRGFTQDDAHLFVTQDQLHEELNGCLELVRTVFNTLGMDDYRVRVGLRDPDGAKYVGDSSLWDQAEAACVAAAESLGVPFSKEAGEAAFYGPKIDFVVRDVLGRQWQLGTVQVDYQLPERFDLTYVGRDNAEHRPVMIHRAPFGSMERFVGVLIEHFNGAFPLWLSPEQVRVLPISDKFLDYAQTVSDALSTAGIRVTIDDSDDRLNAKIKTAQNWQIPYMLIVGGKDQDAGTVSLRHRRQGDQGAMPLDDFVQKVTTQANERSHS